MMTPDKRALDLLAHLGFAETPVHAPDHRRWVQAAAGPSIEVVFCSADVCRWLVFRDGVPSPIASSVTDRHFMMMLAAVCH